jgi:hypothetical protein
LRDEGIEVIVVTIAATMTFCQHVSPIYTYGTPFATLPLGTLFLFVKNENDDENEN